MTRALRLLRISIHGEVLITTKVLDARRRGATTEVYGEQYAARRSNRRERRPSILLRAVSMSNGR